MNLSLRFACVFILVTLNTRAWSFPNKMDATALLKAVKEQESHVVKHEEHVYETTLDLDFQEAVIRAMGFYGKASIAIAAINPITGEIVSLVELRSKEDPIEWWEESMLFKARAPGASLMKIVTSVAALQLGRLRSQDKVKYFGGCLKLRSRNWLKNARRDRLKLSFAKAFGKSCNTVYARIGVYDVGLKYLKEYAHKLYFNRDIPVDFLLEPSQHAFPSDREATPFDVGRTAAGFGVTRMTPIHAALLGTLIHQKGKMVIPYLVKSIKNKNGKVVYLGEKSETERILDTVYVDDLKDLFKATVISGTSRRHFRRRGTRKSRFQMGGKTGTLSDPAQRQVIHTWFTGVSNVDNKGALSVGILVSSPQSWIIRASEVAQTVFKVWLRELKNRKKESK